MSWWSKISLWVKLAVAAVSAFGIYLWFRLRGLKNEAETLRHENNVKRAEARVSYLESQKDSNANRVAEILEEETKLDEAVQLEKKALEEARARVAGMTDDEVAARLRELGY